jgi:Flp pilus assembly protein TadG
LQRHAKVGPRAPSDSGQAIAEFAVSSIVLLVLLLAIIQFAFLYNAQIGLTNGLRDAVRFGSSLTANTDATAQSAANSTYAFLTTSLGSHVSPYSSSRLATGTQVCFEGYTDPTGPAVRVRVTAVYDHPLLVPLINLIIDAFDGATDGSYRITSTIEMRVDNPLDPIPAVSTGPICNT